MDKEIISVTIPNTVIIIGDRAFVSNRLTSLTIPDSVTVIGKDAFANMTSSQAWSFNRDPASRDTLRNNIASLTLGKNVKTIKDRAFYGNRLKSIVIPNSVTKIKQSAFVSNSLNSITIGSNVEVGSEFEPSPGGVFDPYGRLNYGFIGAFEDGFVDYYMNSTNRRAGTYVFNNGQWRIMPSQN